jgi:hypothetical protein
MEKKKNIILNAWGMRKKEIIVWGCIVVVAVGLIVSVTLAQDQGVSKPPTPVYVPPAVVALAVTTAGNLTPATLKQAEDILQQTICNAFPNTALRFPSDLVDLGVLLSSDFDSQVAALGDSVTFGTRVMSTYKNSKFFRCLFRSKTCSLNFTANFAGGAVEQGVVNMTFTGEIGPYMPQNPVPADTQVGDHPVPKNQYSGMDPMPMLTRTSCSVIFQKPCPTKAGSVLCGQCDVNQAGTQYVSKPENLGKCFYCSSNQSCTWGAGGLCSAYSCVNKSNSKTKKAANYFTNCSGCQRSGYYRNYNYSGTNKGTCQNYLRVCRACGAVNMKTNCQ